MHAYDRERRFACYSYNGMTCLAFIIDITLTSLLVKFKTRRLVARLASTQPITVSFLFVRQRDSPLCKKCSKRWTDGHTGGSSERGGIQCRGKENSLNLCSYRSAHYVIKCMLHACNQALIRYCWRFTPFLM